MTITLEVPPEAEARLLAQAKSRGLSLDDYLQTVIVTHSAIRESLKQTDSLPVGDPDRVIDDLFDTVELPPGVGQGVMLRANWYR